MHYTYNRYSYVYMICIYKYSNIKNRTVKFHLFVGFETYMYAELYRVGPTQVLRLSKAFFMFKRRTFEEIITWYIN